MHHHWHQFYQSSATSPLFWSHGAGSTKHKLTYVYKFNIKIWKFSTSCSIVCWYCWHHFHYVCTTMHKNAKITFSRCHAAILLLPMVLQAAPFIIGTIISLVVHQLNTCTGMKILLGFWLNIFITQQMSSLLFGRWCRRCWLHEIPVQQHHYHS